MENTEIMNEVMDTVIEDVVVDEVIANGKKMNPALKGSLITAAIVAGIGLIWKGYGMIKAKKELHQPDNEIIVEDEDLAEVTAE